MQIYTSEGWIYYQNIVFYGPCYNWMMKLFILNGNIFNILCGFYYFFLHMSFRVINAECLASKSIFFDGKGWGFQGKNQNFRYSHV